MTPVKFDHIFTFGKEELNLLNRSFEEYNRTKIGGNKLNATLETEEDFCQVEVTKADASQILEWGMIIGRLQSQQQQQRSHDNLQQSTDKANTGTQRPVTANQKNSPTS
jgi:hypothetical protein